LEYDKYCRIDKAFSPSDSSSWVGLERPYNYKAK
jgi:hypothetical protein